MPLSGRPLITVERKSSFDKVLREVTNEGPTRPSCSAPWQRSQADARHVFQPSSVFGSTLLPSCTVYGAPESWSAACAVSSLRLVATAAANKAAIDIIETTN